MELELFDILNNGSLEELVQLKGIGEVRARYIITMRTEESTFFRYCVFCKYIVHFMN